MTILQVSLMIFSFLCFSSFCFHCLRFFLHSLSSLLFIFWSKWETYSYKTTEKKITEPLSHMLLNHTVINRAYIWDLWTYPQNLLNSWNFRQCKWYLEVMENTLKIPIMVTNDDIVTELKSQRDADWLCGSIVMFNDDTHKWTAEGDGNIRSQ